MSHLGGMGVKCHQNVNTQLYSNTSCICDIYPSLWFHIDVGNHEVRAVALGCGGSSKHPFVLPIILPKLPWHT